MSNSPIRDYILKFHKSVEVGDYILIPFTTLIFNCDFYFAFKDNTYYFSLTGHDLLEIASHDAQAKVLNLCRGIYMAKNNVQTILMQIEFYLNNKPEITYLSSNNFDCLKSESFVGSWVLDKLRIVEGSGMTDQYKKMVGKLIESKISA